ESVALVFDDAVGRVVLAELVGVAAIVAVGQRADRVLRHFAEVDVGGGVAAVHDVLGAGRVGVAVVAALFDLEEVVGHGCRHGRDRRDGRAGVGAVFFVVDAVGLEDRARRRRRRIAVGGRSVGRDVQVPVGVEEQVVRVAHARGVDRQRRVGGER